MAIVPTKPTSKHRDNSDKEIEDQLKLKEQLDKITVAYLRGEVDINTYRAKTKEINHLRRFDLRRLASLLNR